MIKDYNGIRPKIDETAFIEESAQIIGDVEIGKYSSIWFNAVVRGDVNYIKIGERANIQDGSLLHVTRGIYPLFVGDEVTIAHGVTLHGCRIRSKSIIAMGAIVMDGAQVGEESIIGAGSVVVENTRIPSGWLAIGIPAKPKRRLTNKDLKWITESAKNYVEYMETYKRM